MTAPKFRRTGTARLWTLNGHYYLVAEIAGQRYYRTLKIHADPGRKNPALSDADRKELARAAYVDAIKAADHTHRALTMHHLHGGAERAQAERPLSTIADILAAYEAATAGRPDIQPRTIARGIAVTKKVLKTVLGENFSETTTRADILTPDLLTRYEESRIAAAKLAAAKLPKEAARRALESRQNTVRSDLTKLRSLFAKHLRQSHHYAKLKLPDLKTFLEKKIAGSFNRAPQPLKPEIRAALVAGMAGFRTTDPALWFALQLAWQTGIRRDSAIHAQWDWLTAQPDGTVKFHVRIAKEADYILRLPASLAAEWTAAAAGRSQEPGARSEGATENDPAGYIIPGDTEWHREQHIVRAVDWLRSIGFAAATVAKPFHELRKIHGQAFADEFGDEAASARLGHAKHGVTARSYLTRTLESKIPFRMADLTAPAAGPAPGPAGPTPT